MSNSDAGSNRSSTAAKAKTPWKFLPALRANWPYLLLAIGVVMAGRLVVDYWLAPSSPEDTFLGEAEAGHAALANVETRPDRGHAHVQRGQAVDYGEWPPTSGDHDPEPVDPGVYDQPQSPEQLVHSLEHGLIVVHVDDPGADARDALKAWARLLRDPWAGVVVVPHPGLGKAVVLTAWTKLLRLDRFDPAAAAAFIDAYRGRGPEHPVR